MSKTTVYSIAIILLLGANFWLFFGGGNHSEASEARRYFNTESLASVSEISFTSGGQSIHMERQKDEWILNDNYEVDQGFLNTLLSVLERVEVNRSLIEWSGEKAGTVEVITGKETYQFEFATNPTQTKTYFISNDEVQEVVVPGYRDNVAGIFELHPDQWRDRLIVDGSWRTIQQLQVDYTESVQQLNITFDDSFFLVNGATPSDSSAVVDYLNQFQYFQANEMISNGRLPDMDSLSQTNSLATLRIDDIKYDAPLVLTIFPSLPGQGFHLVTNDKNEMMVVDTRRIQAILKTSADFDLQ